MEFVILVVDGTAEGGEEGMKIRQHLVYSLLDRTGDTLACEQRIELLLPKLQGRLGQPSLHCKNVQVL